MEEDIKILEELIKAAKDYNQYEGNKYYKSIENLIKGYKKLEIENKILKAHKNGCPALPTTGVECKFKKDLEELQEENRNIKNHIYYKEVVELNYIPKSKVRKLLKEIDDNNTDEGWWYINKIQELLQDKE